SWRCRLDSDCFSCLIRTGGKLGFLRDTLRPSKRPGLENSKPTANAPVDSHTMTLTEKILARAAGKAAVQAGDNVWVKADVLMTHDVCGPGTIGVFKREFGKTAKVWDKQPVVIIPDHYIFTADSKSNRNVDILRDFVKEQDLPYFYDVIDDKNGH